MKIAKDKVVAGVDLGGTNISVGILDCDGKVVGRAKRKTKASEGRDVVVRRLVEAVWRAMEDAKCDPSSLLGVGVGAPSAVDVSKGMVIKAGNLGWENVPLREILEKEFRLPVALDNDVNVAVWGEAQLGAARGRKNVLAVWVGTGVGGGLILDGKLWRGPFHTAGEIGHVVLFPGGQPGFMTVEDICSRTGVVNALRRLLPMHPDSALHALLRERGAEGKSDDEGSIGSAMIAKAYERGDELTLKVLNQSADLLGLAIANVVTMLAIDTIVIGGGLAEALGKPYLARVRKQFERTVFPSNCSGCEVVGSSLNDLAGVLGAGMLIASS
ncbi:MAG: ROK family protein [Phycisphaerales bacterium]|nr:ROK family protein [Phycisphaerales bacterium]